MTTFRARFLQADELDAYGLPLTSEQPNIISLIEGASSQIDQHCGRTDTDGNGSLVWSTYTERLKMPTGRNVVRVSMKPLVGLSLSVQQTYAASGTVLPFVYTGFLPNGIMRAGGSVLSPFIFASGRYGYGRRAGQAVYPDLNYGINPLMIASWFGGPPNFTNIDVASIDFNIKTGEIWVPAGLYLSQYTDLLVAYNAGFDPLALPEAVKQACAALTRNLLARGGGTTNLRSYTAGKVGGQFTDDLIDPTIERWLRPFVCAQAY